MKFNRLFCGLLALLIPTAVFAEPPQVEKSDALKNAVILVIRHAEKPDTGDGLSAEGEAHARAYVNYFRNFMIDGRPLKLDYLFATADSKGSRRPRLTLEPTSKALGLAVDSRFKNKDFQELVDELRSKSHGKAILIAWHHGEIPALLGALGADTKQVLPNGDWPEDVFGWLIQLRYDQNGQLIDAKRIDENLAIGDSKKS